MPQGRAGSMKPFETNYCTAFPTGTKTNPDQWKHCCAEHDLYFWAGGCKKYRVEADKRLMDCVESTGARKIAFLMHLGVRIGSYSPFKIKEERWGNGWLDGRRDFDPLKFEDLIAIETELQARPSMDITPEILARFFTNLNSQIRENPVCDLK